MATTTSRSRRRTFLVYAIRYGLPLALVILGVVFIILGHGHVSDTQDTDSGASVFTQIPTDRRSFYSAIGVGSIIIAVMVAMIGWFMRLNLEDGDDRKREEAARDYFARTGRWPGEPGPHGPNKG